MAVPAYTTDLSDISTCEALGTWVESTATGWTAGAIPILEPDFFIQGANCIGKYNTTGPIGVNASIFDLGAGRTVASPGAVFIWINEQCPNNVDTLANGGIRVMVGNTSAVFYGWKVGGKDTLPYGGWKCYPVDPSSNVTRDYTVGTPSGTWQWFGAAVSKLANAKGGMGIDVIRSGRGELKCLSGEAANYATFTGAAAANDGTTARWGLCQAVPGGFLQQGLFLMGEAATLVDFRDSNTSVLIADTTKVVSAFNVFEVRNASSRVDWTSISFQAFGTTSRGTFTITDNADINWDGCTFTDVGTFALLANTTVLNSVFRRTDSITTGGATLTRCTFDSNRAAAAVIAATADNAALISNSTFTSDGTGYAIQIGSAIAVPGSPASITLTGNTFTNYATITPGTSGNEVLRVLYTSGILNVTISGGAGTPSVHTAGATVNIITGTVTATVKVLTPAGIDLQFANVMLKATTGSGTLPVDVTVTVTNSGTTATVVHGSPHGLLTGDKVLIKGASHLANNGVFPVTLDGVTPTTKYSYTMGSTPGSNPTGTIKATFVVLNGLTNASGEITMSRAFATAQSVTGWVRKSSTTPYYKTFTLGGTVSTTTGYSSTVQMVADS